MQPSLIPLSPRFDGADIQPQDHARLGAQLARVLSVMDDGEWRSVSELAQAIWYCFEVRDPETSLSAQLRNARKARHGGHRVERKRVGNLSVYRLVRQ